jgi:hypothetical protein
MLSVSTTLHRIPLSYTPVQTSSFRVLRVLSVPLVVTCCTTYCDWRKMGIDMTASRLFATLDPFDLGKLVLRGCAENWATFPDGSNTLRI